MKLDKKNDKEIGSSQQILKKKLTIQKNLKLKK
jgi:hypothetical protein